MMLRLLALGFLLAMPAFAAKRILFVTHSAGFRHDSIRVAIQALNDIGRRTGAFDVTSTEDVAVLNADSLQQYEAVFFFTSGELPISDRQKQDLLDFVLQGKGFGGAHSATDTLYTWPRYGELIGGVFDGHPWVHEATVEVEDPDFPGLRAQAPAFRIVEEFYQFREFSRDRVRVLLTLDSKSIDLTLPGVNRTDRDFALAWCRNYGQGRVFYTALGHFDETWTDRRFQAILESALLWLIRDVDADSTPRSNSRSRAPAIAAQGISTLAGPSEVQAPGSIVAIHGEDLTSGSSLEAGVTPLPERLAGTVVEADGRALPLFSVSPGQVNAQLPFDLEIGRSVNLTVRSVNVSGRGVPVRIDRAAPALISGFTASGVLVVYAGGLGPVEAPVIAGQPAAARPLLSVTTPPKVTVNGREAVVQFAGLAPSLVGIYQINALLPDGSAAPFEVQVDVAGALSNKIGVR